MATQSVDGLVSGLSTSSLIQQLMQAEAAPQTRLKTRVAVEQTVVSAYQSLNSKLAALESASDTMGLATTWTAVKATSSNGQVIATAGTGATTGSLTFDVTNLARAQVSTVNVNPTGDITAANSLNITIGGGAPVAVDITANRTAQGIVNAINAKGIAVKAALVTTSTGDTKLQLTATKTGSAGTFTMDDFGTGLQTAVGATDAVIKVGDPLAGGYTVTSSTNTFSGLMTGVTITAQSLQTNVTVTVAGDQEGIAGKIQAMVDAANSALTEISNLTAYDLARKKGQPLSGDGNVRQMYQAILSTVSNGDIAYGTFKKFGVELDKSGKVAFKKDVFLTEFANNPTSVQTGATKLANAMETLADKTQATVTANTQSRDNMIRSLNDQILNWDIRLNTRRNALIKQFAGLETALGTMKNQSSWLAGQIAGLPTGG